MPAGRPFIDAHAVRGKPKQTSRQLARTKAGKDIRFEPYNSTHISLKIPTYNQMNSLYIREIRVHKKDGIKLAHWLLDICTTSKG